MKKMKTLAIKEMEYPEFEALRDLFYEFIPFALVHVGYSKKMKMCIFNFWDSAYIPEQLTKYIMPFNPNLMKQMELKLDTIFHP